MSPKNQGQSSKSARCRFLPRIGLLILLVTLAFLLETPNYQSLPPSDIRGVRLPDGVKGLREVFFASDRNKTSWASFGEGRNGPGSLALGRCLVSIPQSHTRGQLERPWSFWTISLKEDVTKHMVIHSRAELDTESFYSLFTKSLDDAPDRSAFVFVPGYNVSFDNAILTTAQLAWDMKLGVGDSASTRLSMP